MTPAFFPIRARLPIVCENDRDAIRNALNAAGVADPSAAQVARIVDTLHIEAFAVSEAALEKIDGGERYAVGGASDALRFHGNDLVPFADAAVHA